MPRSEALSPCGSANFALSESEDVATLPAASFDVDTQNAASARRAAHARRAYEQRRVRDDGFGLDAGLFGEPAWDILLDLYHRQLEGRRVAVSASCVASGKPISSAMRHIERLEHQGLVARNPDIADGRRSWMLLTPRGRELMDRVIDRLLTQTGRLD